MHNLTWLYAVIVVTTILTGCNQAQSPTADSDSGWLSGTIIGAMSTPLSGVIVTTSPSSDTAITDSNGRFVLHAPTGVYTVLASKGTTSTQAFYTVLSNDTVQANLRLPVWKLAWNDEFDGNSIDSSQWFRFEGPTGLADQLHRFATDDIIVESGLLRLRSQKRKYGSYEYSSAQVRSYYGQRFGKFEVRARLPYGKGIWPGIWLWRINHSELQEIDIMESIGDPTYIYMTYHFPTSQGGTDKRSRIHIGPDYSQDFHVFAVEWYPDEMRWLIDGVEQFKAPTVGEQFPLAVYLDTYVGGNWPGNPDSTTVFPQYHDIDYVRVYKAAE